MSVSNTPIKRNRTVTTTIKHGLRQAPEYENWHNMKQRCLNPNFYGYKNYGGRGIGICQPWIESFVNFYEDMGQRPTPSHSIERIDNNKGYTPENCKWGTKTEQILNRNLKPNMCGYRGVSVNRTKFKATLWLNYKSYTLASCETPEEAAAMYDSVMMQLYGDNVFTNFDWSPA